MNPVTTVPLDALVARCGERRARLFESLGDGILLLPTAREQLRNGDVLHSHRPGSDLAWLTAFPEPDALLVAWREPRGRGHRVRTVLFVRPKDQVREIWDGRRFGVRQAQRTFGVDEALPIGEFWQRLPELLAPHARVFVRLGADPDFDRRLFAVFAGLARQKPRIRAGLPAHPLLEDPGPALAALRLIKDEIEIACLERAAEISALGHVAAMRAAAPGVGEQQLQAVLEAAFRSLGSRRNGYDSIVASGANACILHYHENDRRSRRGELCLIDAGAEVDLYTADITRTWPVGGRFSDAQRAVYAVVLRAQKAAIRSVRPGAPTDRPHKVAQRELTRGLVELGVLRGDPRRLFAEQKFMPYYMHGTSHWLGMDVHDVGAYQDRDGRAHAFRPGMVLTVEPGLYFGKADRKVPRALRGIGIRIEDDVLVTAEGCRNLTAACPKEIRELEATVGQPAAS
jgi:Xaa-Pro aminopeptidase